MGNLGLNLQIKTYTFAKKKGRTEEAEKQDEIQFLNLKHI
jgi:hypothetical protein